MGGKVLNKMMGFLGLEDEYEDLEEVNNSFEKEEVVEVDPPISSSRKKDSKVVNIHTAAATRVMIIKPTNFEEATDICDDLKNRKIVVVNTSGLESKVAQRMLDFMGGASYALGAELQEVDRGIYILSPSNVEVTNELKSELSNKGLFSWTK